MHLLIILIPSLQIPEEEKNLGPHDRLIHVYHFSKDLTQNQVVCILYESLIRDLHNTKVGFHFLLCIFLF